MCDYCDCRSVELIDRLGRQHARLMTLAGTIKMKALTGDLAEARRCMAHLVAELESHARTEEVALFPALRDAGMASTARDLLGDHHVIDRLVEEAADASDAEWPSIVVELLAVLAAHINDEEYDVFPAAKQLVAPAEWDHAHSRAEQLAS